MMYHNLKKKGWSKQDIEKVKLAEKKVRLESKISEEHLFWLVMVINIGINIAVAFVMIPLLLALKGLGLFMIIVSIGLCTGFAFDFLFRHFTKLTHRHYIMIIGFAPAIAAISIIIASEFANQLIGMLSISNNPHPSILIGIVYGISFLFPFSIKQIFHKMV